MCKKEEKSQKPRWYRYGCSLQASEINPAARWGLCLGNHRTEVKNKCYLASLSQGASERVDAMADRSFSVRPWESQSGQAPLCAGLAGPAGREWKLFIEWHGTRGSPATTQTRGGCEEGEREASNANPWAVSNLPGQDFRDCGILCRNGTLYACVCVCVFHFSVNKKQQQ